LELAKKLVDLGGGGHRYPQAYDLGISMLFRLRSYREIAKCYLKEGEYLKALSFATKYQIPQMMKYEELIDMIDQSYAEMSDP
jgi:hypothetical protein